MIRVQVALGLFQAAAAYMQRGYEPKQHLREGLRNEASNRNSKNHVISESSPLISVLRQTSPHSVRLASFTPAGSDRFSYDAKRFVEASYAFLEASECFDQKAKSENGQYNKAPDGDIKIGTGCPHQGIDDAFKFVSAHIAEYMDLESEVELTLAIAKLELEKPTAENAEIGSASYTTFNAIGRNVATLFAARQASLALRSLEAAVAKERRQTLLSQKRRLEQAVQSALPWFNFGRARHATHELKDIIGEDKVAKWQLAKTVEFELRSFLKDRITRELLELSSTHLLKIDLPALAVAFELPQKSRVRTDVAGAITKESSLHLGQDQQGKPIDIPMVGLGTGFGDCVEGRVLDYDGGKEEHATLTKNPCDTEGPDGWASHVSLVDTAPLYGTESMVGRALLSSGRPRHDYFVMTKLATRSIWPLLHISRGADFLEHQFEDLQMPYVDVLMLHHDGFDESEWNSLENVAKQGKARALGVSGIADAWGVEECIAAGRCNKNAMVAEQVWSPCSTQGVERKVPAGTSVVGTSAVWTCLGEPHTASIARQKNVQPVAVSICWALQSGVPVLTQTQRPSHLRDNLAALEIKLSEREMGLLSMLSTLYRLRGEPDLDVLEAIGEAEER